MSTHDDALRLAARCAEDERRIRELEAEVERLGEQNDQLCDDIERLRAPARRAGLEVEAKRCLEMIARYRAEGDLLDSSRVIITLNHALDALAESKGEAA